MFCETVDICCTGGRQQSGSPSIPLCELTLCRELWHSGLSFKSSLLNVPTQWPRSWTSCLWRHGTSLQVGELPNLDYSVRLLRACVISLAWSSSQVLLALGQAILALHITYLPLPELQNGWQVALLWASSLQTDQEGLRQGEDVHVVAEVNPGDAGELLGVLEGFGEVP